jgi:hypothetical protein
MVFGRVKLQGKVYSEREWRIAINSNQGIFKRLNINPNEYAGPHLTKELTITGDTLTIEGYEFGRKVNKFQRRVWEELMEQDKEKANEYLLTISNAITVWKQDIEVLKSLLDFIRMEEKEFMSDEKRVELLRRHLPSALERHQPDLFKEFKKELENMDSFLRADINRDKRIEFVIKNYFKELRKRKLAFLLK